MQPDYRPILVVEDDAQHALLIRATLAAAETEGEELLKTGRA